MTRATQWPWELSGAIRGSFQGTQGSFSPETTSPTGSLASCPGHKHCDFNNANHVDGYQWENTYIAMQEPLPEIFGDFWQMVWEQQSATIIH